MAKIALGVTPWTLIHVGNLVLSQPAKADGCQLYSMTLFEHAKENHCTEENKHNDLEVNDKDKHVEM